MKLKFVSMLAGVALVLVIAGIQVKNAISKAVHPVKAASNRKAPGRPKIRGTAKILYIGRGFPEMQGTKYRRHITLFIVTPRPYQTATIKRDYLFFKDGLSRLSVGLQFGAWVNPDSMADVQVNWLEKRINAFDPG